MAASGKSVTVNINDDTIRFRVPKRCRRCWHYKDDPQQPSLEESLLILLSSKVSAELRFCLCLVLTAPFAILSYLFIYFMKAKTTQEILEWSLGFLAIFPAVIVLALVVISKYAVVLTYKYSRKMDFQHLCSETNYEDEMLLP